MTATFTCLTCGTVHYSADAYIACRDSHPPPSLVERLRHGSIDDDLLEAAKEAADEIELLRSKLPVAKSGQPYINCWTVRDVYFDDEGNPSMHRDPQQQQRKPPREQITAAAKALCRQASTACNVDFDDNWKLYGDEYIADATAVLNAAYGIGEAQ